MCVSVFLLAYTHLVYNECRVIIFHSFILLRQHGVKDEDTTVRRFLHQEADLYHMDAEVEHLDKR